MAREVSRHRSWWRRALFPLPSAMLEAGERLRRTLSTVAICLVVAGLLAALESMLHVAGDLIGKDTLPAAGGRATRRSSSVCIMPPTELFPPPHGALIAIVSGVAVRSWSATRHSALANTTKPNASSAGSLSGTSATSGTRPRVSNRLQLDPPSWGACSSGHCLQRLSQRRGSRTT